MIAFKKLLRRGLRFTLTTINFLLAVGMLGVYAIPWLDPRLFAPLSLGGFLYYPMLIGLVGCLLVWILRKNYRFWISLVVLALGFRVHPVWWNWSWWGGDKPYTQALTLGDSPRMPLDSQGHWKVISYNVGNFSNAKISQAIQKPISSSRDFLIHLLSVVQPDLVALQDFISWEPGKPDVLRSLMLHPELKGYTLVGQDAKLRSFLFPLDDQLPKNARLFRYQDGGFALAGTGELTNWLGGMVMLSRWPVLNSGYRNLGEPGRNGGMMWIDILVAKDTLRCINLHLASNRISTPELNPLHDLDVQSDSSQRTIKGVLRKIAYSARLRAQQADQIKAFMDDSPYPLLVTGDFNDLPYSYAVSRIQGKLQDSFVAKGNGFGNTYGRGIASFRIDHIMADPTFPIQSHEVVRLSYSDHYPVVVVLGR
jgi:endonuclease/exonuclease/phosphatase family metal-dependent hydrolase